jgi:hypothetical protein
LALAELAVKSVSLGGQPMSAWSRGLRRSVVVGALLGLAACHSNTQATLLSLAVTTQPVPSGAQTGLTVSVSANVSWTAVADQSFVTITAGSSGTTSGTITFNVSGNTGAERTAHITITGGGSTATLLIDQASGLVSPTLSLGATSQEVNSNAQSALTITVTSTVSWTATSDQSFLTISSGSSGSNNGSVTFAVTSNTGASSRVAHVTISGGGLTATFTLTQDAPSGPPAVTLSVNPSTASLSADAQTATTNVTSNTSWSAASDQAFLTFVGLVTGTNNGVLTYSLPANGGSSRTGHVTVSATGIGNQILTVTQAGLTAAFSVTVDETGDPNTCSASDPQPCFSCPIKSVSSGTTANGTPAIGQILCTFNASTSSPQSLITSFNYIVVGNGELLGTASKVADPFTACGYPVGSTPTAVRLTIKTAAGGQATLDVTIHMIHVSAC